MSSHLRFAVWLALATAVISGVNNFLTKIAVTAVSDPIVFTFLKNAVVALALLGFFTMTQRWREVRTLARADALRLLAIGIVGGSVPFILFFTGLTMVPAVTAAFIHKTLFLWVVLLAVPILKERIGIVQGAAITLLGVGTFVITGLPLFTLGRGELMILAATILWAVENIIAKVALRNLSSTLVAGARMTIGALVIFVVIALQGKTALLVGLSGVQWGWTTLTSVLLLGYVCTWYTALKYAPATLVACLLVPAVFITTALHALFVTHTLTGTQAVSGILLLCGAALLAFTAHRIVPTHHTQPATAHA